MRSFKLKTDAKPCPKCGNTREFTAHSQQVCEDGCEVWVVCYRCGYDPTKGKIGHRVESVMGGIDDDNVLMAVAVWNEELT